MRVLPITIFKQNMAECGVAASASVANYYNNEISYELTRKLAKKISSDFSDEGMDTGEIGILLNKLGFKKVSIVTSDLNIVDFTWSRLNKTAIKKELMKKYRKDSEADFSGSAYSLYKFLCEKQRINKIIIDNNFGYHIRRNIDNRNPVLLTINWTVLFRKPKYNENDKQDPILGESERHMVICVGYDQKYVCLADPHNDRHNNRDITYCRKGFYKISWEKLMTVLGLGDIIIPERYRYELV
jgi:hypothetical protein